MARSMVDADVGGEQEGLLFLERALRLVDVDLVADSIVLATALATVLVTATATATVEVLAE